MALKLLLRGADQTFLELAGVKISRWLDVELPKIQNPRADLLGETAEGELIHVELQSANDPQMGLRMLEYCLGIYRRFGKFPRQIVLYVGEGLLRMDGALQSEALSFRCRVTDARDLDGGRLMESGLIGDNVMAILARLTDPDATIREIVRKMRLLDDDTRNAAANQLMILAGLRRLEDKVEEEIEKMPVTADIMTHKIVAREYNRGRQEGQQEGRKEGQQAGELTILRKQISKRFGPIPEWAESALAQSDSTVLEALSLRLFDAQSLEELFGK